MTSFCIPHDHPSLPGHFPGHPVVPGVLLLEQVLRAIESTHGTAMPLRLPRVKFARALLPGEEARLEIVPADAAQDGGRRWRFRVLRADGALLASGEVVA
jgi:3-hydroxyacyl-[acyl-carrier-protein] dehydratase